MCSNCDWNWQPENEPPDETLHERDPEYEAWAAETYRRDTLEALDAAIESERSALEKFVDEGGPDGDWSAEVHYHIEGDSMVIDAVNRIPSIDPMQTMLERAYASRLHTHDCGGPCERKDLACLKVPCEYRPFDFEVDGRRQRWMCADCRDQLNIPERRSV